MDISIKNGNGIRKTSNNKLDTCAAHKSIGGVRHSFLKIAHGEKTPENARLLCMHLRDYMIQWNKHANRTESFLKFARRKVLFVHFYLCNVAQVTNTYNLNYYMKEALLSYVLLEINVLEKTKSGENLTGKSLLQLRMIRLLWTIYSKYYFYLTGRLDRVETWRMIYRFLQFELPANIPNFFMKVLVEIKKMLPVEFKKPILSYYMKQSDNPKQSDDSSKVKDAQIDLTNESHGNDNVNGSENQLENGLENVLEYMFENRSFDIDELDSAQLNGEVMRRLKALQNKKPSKHMKPSSAANRSQKPLTKANLKEDSLICIQDDSDDGEPNKNCQTEIHKSSNVLIDLTKDDDEDDDDSLEDDTRQRLMDQVRSLLCEFETLTGTSEVTLRMKNGNIEVNAVQSRVPMLRSYNRGYYEQACRNFIDVAMDPRNIRYINCSSFDNIRVVHPQSISHAQNTQPSGNCRNLSRNNKKESFQIVPNMYHAGRENSIFLRSEREHASRHLDQCPQQTVPHSPETTPSRLSQPINVESPSNPASNEIGALLENIHIEKTNQIEESVINNEGSLNEHVHSREEIKNTESQSLPVDFSVQSSVPLVNLSTNSHMNLDSTIQSQSEQEPPRRSIIDNFYCKDDMQWVPLPASCSKTNLNISQDSFTLDKGDSPYEVNPNVNEDITVPLSEQSSSPFEHVPSQISLVNEHSNLDISTVEVPASANLSYNNNCQITEVAKTPNESLSFKCVNTHSSELVGSIVKESSQVTVQEYSESKEVANTNLLCGDTLQVTAEFTHSSNQYLQDCSTDNDLPSQNNGQISAELKNSSKYSLNLTDNEFLNKNSRQLNTDIDLACINNSRAELTNPSMDSFSQYSQDYTTENPINNDHSDTNNSHRIDAFLHPHVSSKKQSTEILSSQHHHSPRIEESVNNFSCGENVQRTSDPMYTFPNSTGEQECSVKSPIGNNLSCEDNSRSVNSVRAALEAYPTCPVKDEVSNDDNSDVTAYSRRQTPQNLLLQDCSSKESLKSESSTRTMVKHPSQPVLENVSYENAAYVQGCEIRYSSIQELQDSPPTGATHSDSCETTTINRCDLSRKKDIGCKEKTSQLDEDALLQELEYHGCYEEIDEDVLLKEEHEKMDDQSCSQATVQLDTSKNIADPHFDADMLSANNLVINDIESEKENGVLVEKSVQNSELIASDSCADDEKRKEKSVPVNTVYQSEQLPSTSHNNNVPLIRILSDVVIRHGQWSGTKTTDSDSTKDSNSNIEGQKQNGCFEWCPVEDVGEKSSDDVNKSSGEIQSCEDPLSVESVPSCEAPKPKQDDAENTEETVQNVPPNVGPPTEDSFRNLAEDELLHYVPGYVVYTREQLRILKEDSTRERDDPRKDLETVKKNSEVTENSVLNLSSSVNELRDLNYVAGPNIKEAETQTVNSPRPLDELANRAIDLQGSAGCSLHLPTSGSSGSNNSIQETIEALVHTEFIQENQVIEKIVEHSTIEPTKVPNSYLQVSHNGPDNNLMALASIALQNESAAYSGDMSLQHNDETSDSSDSELRPKIVEPCSSPKSADNWKESSNELSVAKRIPKKRKPGVRSGSRRHRTKGEMKCMVMLEQSNKSFSEDDMPLTDRLKKKFYSLPLTYEDAPRTTKVQRNKKYQLQSPLVESFNKGGSRAINKGEKSSDKRTRIKSSPQDKKVSSASTYTSKLRSRSQSSGEKEKEEMNPTSTKGKSRKASNFFKNSNKALKTPKQPTEKWTKKEKEWSEPTEQLSHNIVDTSLNRVNEGSTYKPVLVTSPWISATNPSKQALAASPPKKRFLLLEKKHAFLEETTKRLEERQKSKSNNIIVEQKIKPNDTAQRAVPEHATNLVVRKKCSVTEEIARILKETVLYTTEKQHKECSLTVTHNEVVKQSNTSVASEDSSLDDLPLSQLKKSSLLETVEPMLSREEIVPVSLGGDSENRVNIISKNRRSFLQSHDHKEITIFEREIFFDNGTVKCNDQSNVLTKKGVAEVSSKFSDNKFINIDGVKDIPAVATPKDIRSNGRINSKLIRHISKHSSTASDYSNDRSLIKSSKGPEETVDINSETITNDVQIDLIAAESKSENISDEFPDNGTNEIPVVENHTNDISENNDTLLMEETHAADTSKNISDVAASGIKIESSINVITENNEHRALKDQLNKPDKCETNITDEAEPNISTLITSDNVMNEPILAETDIEELEGKANSVSADNLPDNSNENPVNERLTDIASERFEKSVASDNCNDGSILERSPVDLAVEELQEKVDIVSTEIVLRNSNESQVSECNNTDTATEELEEKLNAVSTNITSDIIQDVSIHHYTMSDLANKESEEKVELVLICNERSSTDADFQEKVDVVPTQTISTNSIESQSNERSLTDTITEELEDKVNAVSTSIALDISDDVPIHQNIPDDLAIKEYEEKVDVVPAQTISTNFSESQVNEPSLTNTVLEEHEDKVNVVSTIIASDVSNDVNIHQNIPDDLAIKEFEEKVDALSTRAASENLDEGSVYEHSLADRAVKESQEKVDSTQSISSNSDESMINELKIMDAAIEGFEENVKAAMTSTASEICVRQPSPDDSAGKEFEEKVGVVTSHTTSEDSKEGLVYEVSCSNTAIKDFQEKVDVVSTHIVSSDSNESLVNELSITDTATEGLEEKVNAGSANCNEVLKHGDSDSKEFEEKVDVSTHTVSKNTNEDLVYEGSPANTAVKVFKEKIDVLTHTLAENTNEGSVYEHSPADTAIKELDEKGGVVSTHVRLENFSEDPRLCPDEVAIREFEEKVNIVSTYTISENSSEDQIYERSSADTAIKEVEGEVDVVSTDSVLRNSRDSEQSSTDIIIESFEGKVNAVSKCISSDDPIHGYSTVDIATEGFQEQLNSSTTKAIESDHVIIDSVPKTVDVFKSEIISEVTPECSRNSESNKVACAELGTNGENMEVNLAKNNNIEVAAEDSNRNDKSNSEIVAEKILMIEGINEVSPAEDIHISNEENSEIKNIPKASSEVSDQDVGNEGDLATDIKASEVTAITPAKGIEMEIPTPEVIDFDNTEITAVEQEDSSEVVDNIDIVPDYSNEVSVERDSANGSTEDDDGEINEGISVEQNNTVPPADNNVNLKCEIISKEEAVNRCDSVFSELMGKSSAAQTDSKANYGNEVANSDFVPDSDASKESKNIVIPDHAQNKPSKSDVPAGDTDNLMSVSDKYSESVKVDSDFPSFCDFVCEVDVRSENNTCEYDEFYEGLYETLNETSSITKIDSAMDDLKAFKVNNEMSHILLSKSDVNVSKTEKDNVIIADPTEDKASESLVTGEHVNISNILETEKINGGNHAVNDIGLRSDASEKDRVYKSLNENFTNDTICDEVKNASRIQPEIDTIIPVNAKTGTNNFPNEGGIMEKGLNNVQDNTSQAYTVVDSLQEDSDSEIESKSKYLKKQKQKMSARVKAKRSSPKHKNLTFTVEIEKVDLSCNDQNKTNNAKMKKYLHNNTEVQSKTISKSVLSNGITKEGNDAEKSTNRNQSELETRRSKSNVKRKQSLDKLEPAISGKNHIKENKMPDGEVAKTEGLISPLLNMLENRDSLKSVKESSYKLLIKNKKEVDNIDNLGSSKREKTKPIRSAEKPVLKAKSSKNKSDNNFADLYLKNENSKNKNPVTEIKRDELHKNSQKDNLGKVFDKNCIKASKNDVVKSSRADQPGKGSDQVNTFDNLSKRNALPSSNSKKVEIIVQNLYTKKVEESHTNNKNKTSNSKVNKYNSIEQLFIEKSELTPLTDDQSLLRNLNMTKEKKSVSKITKSVGFSGAINQSHQPMTTRRGDGQMEKAVSGLGGILSSKEIQEIDKVKERKTLYIVLDNSLVDSTTPTSRKRKSPDQIDFLLNGVCEPPAVTAKKSKTETIDNIQCRSPSEKRKHLDVDLTQTSKRVCVEALPFSSGESLIHFERTYLKTDDDQYVSNHIEIGQVSESGMLPEPENQHMSNQVEFGHTESPTDNQNTMKDGSLLIKPDCVESPMIFSNNTSSSIQSVAEHPYEMEFPDFFGITETVVETSSQQMFGFAFDNVVTTNSSPFSNGEVQLEYRNSTVDAFQGQFNPMYQENTSDCITVSSVPTSLSQASPYQNLPMNNSQDLQDFTNGFAPFCPVKNNALNCNDHSYADGLETVKNFHRSLQGSPINTALTSQSTKSPMSDHTSTISSIIMESDNVVQYTNITNSSGSVPSGFNPLEASQNSQFNTMYQDNPVNCINVSSVPNTLSQTTTYQTIPVNNNQDLEGSPINTNGLQEFRENPIPDLTSTMDSMIGGTLESDNVLVATTLNIEDPNENISGPLESDVLDETNWQQSLELLCLQSDNSKHGPVYTDIKSLDIIDDVSTGDSESDLSSTTSISAVESELLENKRSPVQVPKPKKEVTEALEISRRSQRRKVRPPPRKKDFQPMVSCNQSIRVKPLHTLLNQGIESGLKSELRKSPRIHGSTSVFEENEMPGNSKSHIDNLSMLLIDNDLDNSPATSSSTNTNIPSAQNRCLKSPVRLESRKATREYEEAKKRSQKETKPDPFDQLRNEPSNPLFEKRLKIVNSKKAKETKTKKDKQTEETAFLPPLKPNPNQHFDDNSHDICWPPEGNSPKYKAPSQNIKCRTDPHEPDGFKELRREFVTPSSRHTQLPPLISRDKLATVNSRPNRRTDPHTLLIEKHHKDRSKTSVNKKDDDQYDWLNKFPKELQKRGQTDSICLQGTKYGT